MSAQEPRTADSLEDNLKKALTELLILTLLSRREHYVGELTMELERQSGGIVSVIFPYGVIYRMTRAEYIVESKKRNAPDGRLRQYYTITDTGRAYLAELQKVYQRFTLGVTEILKEDAAHE